MLNVRRISVPVIYCLPFLLVVSASSAEKRRLSPAAEFLRQAPIKLQKRSFGLNELRTCEQLLKKARKSESLAYLLILAQYQRIMQNNPLGAMRILAPSLLEKDKIRTWEKAQAAAQKEAIAKWRQEVRQARRQGRTQPPEKPRHLLVPFPPPDQWALDYKNAKFAIEITRCLMALRNYQQALTIINAIGGKFRDEPRALAAECAGDLMVQMQVYRKAIDFYRFGLKVLEELKSYDEDLSVAQKIIRDRIRGRLAEAKRLLEMEQYGLGWVKYRDAEQKRRKEKAYLEAFLQYEDIRKAFPNTVYSEAATAYSIQCLLALVDKAGVDRIKRAIQKTEATLKARQMQLSKMKRAKAPRTLQKEIADAIEKLRARIRQMKAVPAGDAAAREATRRAWLFLRKNEFGLYRGEVMLALGNYFLEEDHHARRAEAWYARAAKWFDEVKTADARLDAFDVPGKAKEVSAPPPTERKRDAWTNVVMQEPKIGDIFNRRTCPWYCGRLRKEVAMKRGFIAFVYRDFKKARSFWEILHDLDPFFARQERAGWGSVVQRLLWNIEYNKGCLYATPPEMQAFREPNVRLAVYLADLAFENSQYERAGQRYERIMAGDYGKLNTNQKAYVTFALAMSYDLQWRTKEADALLAKYDTDFRNTPTTPRALLKRGDRTLTDLTKIKPGSEEDKKGLRDYAAIVRRYPRTIHADYALFNWGNHYYQTNRLTKAQVKFEEYLRRYPDGMWVENARHWLQNCKSGVTFDDVLRPWLEGTK